MKHRVFQMFVVFFNALCMFCCFDIIKIIIVIKLLANDCLWLLLQGKEGLTTTYWLDVQ